MSDLLQQAMIDAKALKEVAMKNAENALIEKYSQEFNQTVQKLLEQEEVAAQPEQQNAAPPLIDLETPPEQQADTEQTPDLSAASADPMTSGDITSTTATDKFSKVPGSFSDISDDELITINFDQIRTALNEMMGERYDSGLKQDVADDALNKGGNPTMKVKVKGSKNAVTEKWTEDELEEDLLEFESDEQELEEQPQPAPAAPTSPASPAPPAAPAQAAASSKEDEEFAKVLKAAHIDPKRPVLQATKNLIADMKSGVKNNAHWLAPALGGGVLANLMGYLLSHPQQYQQLLNMVSGVVKEEELEEGDAVTAGADDMKRAADLKKQAADAEARGQTAKAKASAEEDKAVQKTMEEEIELTEEELQELAEELHVDLKSGNLSDGYMGSTETQKREQRAVELAAARDQKAAEEREEELSKMKDLMQENKNLKALNGDTTKTLSALKDQLEKMNLVNAKLLYTNKALGNISLNERQKSQIVESISKADSVLAAKTIYETIQNAVESAKIEKEAPQSLRETLNRAPTPYAVKKSANNSINDLMAERMKALAGIKHTK